RRSSATVNQLCLCRLPLCAVVVLLSAVKDEAWAQTAGPARAVTRGMSMTGKAWLGVLAACVAAVTASGPAAAQQQQKPNILLIRGDAIGGMQPSISPRGLMVGETPNIARIAREGAMYVASVAMQSCPSGRNAFFRGIYPLRPGMIPPQLPG